MKKVASLMTLAAVFAFAACSEPVMQPNLLDGTTSF